MPRPSHRQRAVLVLSASVVGCLALLTPTAAVASAPPRPVVAVQWNGAVQVGNPFTGKLKALAPGVRGEQFHPSWSPDGRRVAFAADDEEGTRDIWVADARTGTANKLVDCVAPTCFFVDDPAWSPDGRSIAFERVLVRPDEEGVPSLRVIDVATRQQRTVAAFPADFTPYTPSWGPGGRALVFELDRFASGRYDESEVRDIRIQTVDVRSGQRHTLTDPATNAQIPSWNSKDGRIVYVQPLDRDLGFFGPLDLVIIDRNGRYFATRVGLRGERALQPSWTPDGSSIVFVFEHELYDSRIAFLDPETGRITKTTTSGTHPTVRP